MTRELSPLTRSEEDRRELILWAVACAERVLPLFEEACPSDRRPRAALTGAMAFAHGDLRVGAVRKLAVACHAAAREASKPAATAVARACGHAAAVAHMASHARGVPRYVLIALALAFANDPTVVDREDEWQRAQLPDRFAEFVYPGGRVWEAWRPSPGRMRD